jgi:2-methylcitrate dehydratase
VLAYDIYCTFCEAIDINSKGWDQPVYSVIASAVGAAKLLGLNREQTENAVSLALTPNMALDQTRHGELSSWKGCAGANASRNGVYAALLAQDGFTGPTAVFEGKAGLFDIVGKFAWPMPTRPDARTSIGKTHMKCFPVCYHGQSAVWAALDARDRVRCPDIAEIKIETYEHAVYIMGADESRWNPATRETADHSLPYVVAIALLDGDVTTASFAKNRLADAEVKRIMAKVKVSEDAALSAQYPECAPCRLSFRMASGEVIVSDVKYPKGHNKSPLNDSEIERKFRGMFREFGSEEQCSAALDGLWKFEQARDVADVLKLFRTRPDRT